MTRVRLALGLVVFMAIAGCKSSPSQARLRTAAGSLPETAASSVPATPAPAATPRATIGLLGIAELPGGVLAGADLKVFKPGSAIPVATGKTRADGAFVVDLAGKAVPDGALLKIVATRDGQSLAGIVAAGGMHLIGNDGGTLVAAGGLNVVPTNAGALIGNDGSTLVAAGGGNLVAAGGGNLVAAGGGNYRLLAAPPRGELRLSIATTIAVAVLGKRLDGALGAAYKGDKMVEGAVDQVMAAYGQFAAASKKSLEGDGAEALVARVVASVGDNGAIDLPADVVKDLAALSGELRQAFVTAAEALGTAIATAVLGGGQVTGGTEPASFGDALAGQVNLPAAPPAGSGGGTAGGGSSTGGSNDDDFGADGADDEDSDVDLSNGSVTIRGNFNPPSPQPNR